MWLYIGVCMYTVLTLAHVHCTHRHWDSSAYPRADPSKSIHSIAYIPLNIFLIDSSVPLQYQFTFQTFS